MCGIFGIVCHGEARGDPAFARRAAEVLMTVSEVRGKEATGLALRTGREIRVFKSAGRASTVAKGQPFRRFLESAFGARANGPTTEPLVFIGHSRLVTNGYRSFDDNNQPVVTERAVGVHNGIVVEHEALARRHGLSLATDVDSEVIFRLIDARLERERTLPRAIGAAFSEISGVANIAMLSSDHETLDLATNNGSIYLQEDKAKRTLVFASESHLLRRALDLLGLGGAGGEAIRHVAAGHGASVSLTDGVVTHYPLGSPPANTEPRSPKPLTIVWRRPSREAMRRCTRCILPGTFPGITFDASGVCSVCASHDPRQLHGREALERLVAPHRSKDGSADCIVAFSGGRDSSYGLHYLKRELGMNPIAYTFDWGMVTDIARRNISRLCETLKVEHLLRSPDIPAKRRYIRKNIEAWLHRPELGMIPLFMAGDKQFYHYGRRVRQETGIPLVFFCAGNPLERTEFKSGFCGVREAQHGQVLWKYSIGNKLRLATYYLAQYIKNPRYLNASLADTLFAFYSTYVERDDFAYLYHYIPWDEQLIDRTLVDEYGWESAASSSSSWRIGDGTAAFYNYIYHSIAGFSEHDTFRSNQVRAGLLDRGEALRQAEIDNRPRWDAMQEYAALVGFNLEEALVVINNAPKLYDRT